MSGSIFAHGALWAADCNLVIQAEYRQHWSIGGAHGLCSPVAHGLTMVIVLAVLAFCGGTERSNTVKLTE